MKLEEVAALLDTISNYQNVKDAGSEDVRDAWFCALDMRMTLTEAVHTVTVAASQGKWINPGVLNDAFLEKVRPPHQQGPGKPHLPFGEPAQAHTQAAAPLQIGAAVPVKPQDVPEYVAARQGKVYGNVPAWKVACPHCKAKPDHPCIVTATGKPLTHRKSHPSRESLAGVPDELSGKWEAQPERPW